MASSRANAPWPSRLSGMASFNDGVGAVGGDACGHVPAAASLDRSADADPPLPFELGDRLAADRRATARPATQLRAPCGGPPPARRSGPSSLVHSGACTGHVPRAVGPERREVARRSSSSSTSHPGSPHSHTNVRRDRVGIADGPRPSEVAADLCRRSRRSSREATPGARRACGRRVRPARRRRTSLHDRRRPRESALASRRRHHRHVVLGGPRARSLREGRR